MITIIGDHKVKCGDIMDGISDLMGNDMADIFYSDPPWAQGNMTYWETMRIKQDKLDQDNRINRKCDDFLSILFDNAIKYAKDIVMIEYGKRWSKELISAGTSSGLNYLTTIDTNYKSGSKLLPMHLHIFAKIKRELSIDYINSVTGTNGYETISRACKPFCVKGGMILDPCCGMGYAAQVALDNNMRFRGNEMNKFRLEKTIIRLS